MKLARDGQQCGAGQCADVNATASLMNRCMFGVCAGLRGRIVDPFCWSGMKIKTFGGPVGAFGECVSIVSALGTAWPMPIILLRLSAVPLCKNARLLIIRF